jgi:hypothetical protein
MQLGSLEVVYDIYLILIILDGFYWGASPPPKVLKTKTPSAT